MGRCAQKRGKKGRAWSLRVAPLHVTHTPLVCLYHASRLLPPDQAHCSHKRHFSSSFSSPHGSLGAHHLPPAFHIYMFICTFSPYAVIPWDREHGHLGALAEQTICVNVFAIYAAARGQSLVAVSGGMQGQEACKPSVIAQKPTLFPCHSRSDRLDSGIGWEAMMLLNAKQSIRRALDLADCSLSLCPPLPRALVSVGRAELEGRGLLTSRGGGVKGPLPRSDQT